MPLDSAKKPAWSVKSSLVVLIFGLFVLGLSFENWYQTKSTVYRTPSFESLQVVSGNVAHFTEKWKSSGGAIVLTTDNGTQLTLKCGGPYGESACFHLLQGGENGGAKYIGKKVTAWWQPINEEYGRLFQLAIEHTTPIKYQERANAFASEYQHGRPESLMLAIFAAIFIVFPAIRSLVRNAKKNKL